MSTIVTVNGQITIDAKFRRELGINPGDTVEMRRLGDMLLITKKNPELFDNPPGILSEDISRLLRTDLKTRYGDMFE